jgi:L-alanine-DL-glutamate epimerase-like enolase superfamily enzyme
MTMKLRILDFDLPLQHPFTISRETITSQPTVIVQLQEGGRSGYGEAVANNYYGFSSTNIRSDLERVRSLVETAELQDPAELWSRLHPRLKDNPFALCAIDQAAHDLWGKQQGKPVYELWGLNTKRCPLTDYTIGIDDIDVMVAKMNQFPDWPVYKIKLGTERDLDIVRELRKQTQATFRVDANCGWTADETIENSIELKKLGVEFIEQPLPADQWDAMLRVRQQSALPVIADESCIVEEDVDRCRDYFHGVNIKLMKCGGLTPARRMIDRARELGLQVMVGCMTESSVGISAIAQLLPLLDYVDMDGALLLAHDIASGVTIEKGRCIYPDVNGNGVALTAA